MCYQAAKNGVIVSTKPIPNTFEDCSEGDKVLITTRDVSLCFSLDHISSLTTLFLGWRFLGRVQGRLLQGHWHPARQLYPSQPLRKTQDCIHRHA